MDDLDDLKARLAEAEETLDAIRSGKVDALVVHGENGDEVYTLAGADRAFRELAERMSDGAATIGDDGTILWANGQLAALSGLPPEQLLGAAIWDVFDPECADTISRELEAGRLAEHSEEVELRRVDRSPLPVRLSVMPVSVGGVDARALVITDLTEHRRTEEVLRESAAELEKRVQQRTEELVQAQKMEIVGRLAGGVAHDFNNILTAIIGYADVAATMSSDLEQQRVLATVKQAAERASGLTQQLLAFSRRQRLDPQSVEVNDVIFGMESILRRLIGEDIELVSSVTPHLGRILVDRTQLEQAVLNLAVNARDAMPHGGRLILRTELTHVDGSNSQSEMPPGEYVTISVADNGIGIDETTRAHMFEPFFTTKEVGKGTGLGLATTYGIVRQSGGFIRLFSEVGHGTVFTMYFPRIQSLVAPTGKDVRPEPRAERRGRILLVEDEALIRDLARQLLTRDGFEVVHASSPAQALELCDRDVPRFDLLLSDVVMPEMTGIELARRLRERHPNLPVLFMSGYAEDVAEVPSSISRHFLAKPFTPDSLLRAVDDALSSTARKSRSRATG